MSRRIIDVHNHPNWHGTDIDALVRNMDSHGIEKTWLLSWELPERELDLAPIYHSVMDPRGVAAPLWMVVEGLRRHPGRFIGGWAPDPRDRHVRSKLKAAVDIHGIKVYGELKVRMRYDSPDAIAVFRYCGELGLPVLFHLQFKQVDLDRQCKNVENVAEWYGGDIQVVDAMCSNCPKTIFIGHATAFWRAISGGAEADKNTYPKGRVKPGGALLKLLRKHKNLYCDLSAGSGLNALRRDMEHARKFVLRFQDRLVFGRDYFDSRLTDALEELDLGEKVMDKILHRNAEELLRREGRKRK